MFTKKPSKQLSKELKYHMSKQTLAEKVKAAKFNMTQKFCLLECLSHAHMRGVRFGYDPSCRENMAFVLKEIKYSPVPDCEQLKPPKNCDFTCIASELGCIAPHNGEECKSFYKRLNALKE
jgi:hypothetical protein